jgi:PAS domain S-box-containing protein
MAAPLLQEGPARARISLRERLGATPNESLARLFFLRRPATSMVSAPIPRRPVSHTCEMATGLKVGGDVEQALEQIAVPSYVLDEAGVVRWLNAAAVQLVGDVRGRHFTSVVAPEDSRRARELFARKVIGAAPATEATAHLVSTGGRRVAVEISAVPLRSGERVVGVFGLIEGRPDGSSTTPPAHLTPRQVEVLRLLEQGRSTKQIAAELHLSTETVRNHVRRLFRALGVNTRLEAVAAARAASSS